MSSFLIYLIESGIVLTLLYLGYILFLRKETYFNFIRFYLLFSLILALLLPATHIKVNLKGDSKILEPAKQISRFRSYYEQLVYWTDSEFIYDQADKSMAEKKSSDNTYDKKSAQSSLISDSKLTITQKLILWIYMTGLAFFILRFIYLLAGLGSYYKKCQKEHVNGLEVINLSDEVPSFSFFNFVFVNKDALSREEFRQVFAHESVHAKEKHSIDLIFAHLFTIFQWYNPLVWRMHKSMKIVHEYIADRKMVEQGFGLFDYQSLLLSQLVSIRSVELVNNFNLLSIKKRIAMMNKMKSGFMAKLKALAIVPVVLAVFFACADMNFGKQESDTESQTGLNVSTYADNSGITRPHSGYYQEFNPLDMTFQIQFDGDIVSIGDTTCNVDDFSETLKKEIKGLETQPPYLSASLDMDKDAQMQDIEMMFKGMRENNLLKIAYVVDPDNKTSLNNTLYAYFFKLPPIDAELKEINEFVSNNITIYVFDENHAISDIKGEIQKLITSDDKYIMVFNYFPGTTYDTYVKYTTAVREVFLDVRNKYAVNKFGDVYESLDRDQQQEIWQKYPITLVSKLKSD